MTNEQILMVETQKLAQAGILKYTGRVFKGVNLAGEEVEIKEVEPIHTFNGWRDRGYSVKKGAKSEIKFPIWHYKKNKPKHMNEEEAVEKGYCYMRTASWFTYDQVETEEERKRRHEARSKSN